MKVIGNIRKMRTALEGGLAHYHLPLKDVLDDHELVDMNALIGKEISMRFEGVINCVVTGKKINKTFGDGMSYEAFMSSPMAVESIIRPELSRIHEGIALRDKEWEEAHHNQPHIVYLSLTSGIKVGVTRVTNIPSRWIDQGATEAILFAETPYRQLAGLIEVAMKDHIADKTNWRNMLKNVFVNQHGLVETKEELLEEMPEEYYDFVSDDDSITKIEFPVIRFPDKVSSLKFDKEPVIEGVLEGIKGQYLLLSGDRVINLRSHAGYRITFES